MLWENVPKLWDGNTAYLLGGGPSLAKVKLESLRHERVIAINNAYLPGRAPWAPILYFMDWNWYQFHKGELAKWSGLKVTVCEKCKPEPGIRVLRWKNRLGIDEHPDHIARGTCAGFGAISLAILLGVKRIILLGYDMQIVDGKHNYHDEHQRKVNKEIYENNFMKPFASLVKPVEDRGIEIINATPGSALPFFPIVDPQEVMP